MKSFGALTIIKDEPGQKLVCKCECGNEIKIYRCDFERGSNSHCGCKKDKHDNKLTKEFLIEQYINQQKSPIQICKEFNIKSPTSIRYWLGKYSIPKRDAKNAEELNTNRCLSNRKYYQEITGSYWCRVLHGAKSRNLEFNITKEYAWNIFLKQNRKCTLTGRDLTFMKSGSALDRNTQTASLDRINSDLGYIEGNIQWIHKDLQSIKMCLTNLQLFNLSKNIYEYCKDIYN